MGPPQYDSGWVPLAPGAAVTKTHNLGGDPDHYFVDFQCKEPVTAGVNLLRYGIDKNGALTYGAGWTNLTATTIRIKRESNDTLAPEVRIRIWKY